MGTPPDVYWVCFARHGWFECCWLFVASAGRSWLAVENRNGFVSAGVSRKGHKTLMVRSDMNLSIGRCNAFHRERSARSEALWAYRGAQNVTLNSPRTVHNSVARGELLSGGGLHNSEQVGWCHDDLCGRWRAAIRAVRSVSMTLAGVGLGVSCMRVGAKVRAVAAGPLHGTVLTRADISPIFLDRLGVCPT